MQPSSGDLAKRFGAAVFAEHIDQDDGDETFVLSLDALRAAFVETQTGNAEEQNEVEEPVEEKPEENEEPEDEIELAAELPSHQEIRQIDVKNIVEAMLFVGDRNNQPLSPQRAAEKMRNVSPEEIEQAVAALNQTYTQCGCPYEIQQEPEGYRLVLRSGFEAVREKFYGKHREAVLSQPAVDTLAVVAYRQPLTAEDVQKLRKQPSAALLSQLVKRGLLRREEKTVSEQTNEGAVKKKKAVYYRTTERFLELFQLHSLDDLPVPEDVLSPN